MACIAIAVAARLLGTWIGIGIDTALALLLGLAVGGIAGGILGQWRGAFGPGAALAARVALRLGVALLGARLTLGQVLETGGSSVLAIVAVVATALAMGALFARRAGVMFPLSWLITAGMAICGNSAILALAPIVRAPNRDTAYAVSTITIFGLLGVLLLPAAGTVLGLDDAVLGMWAGLSVNDTAQVVAAGYAYSAPAGDVATIVKLTRNLAILPVLVGAAHLVSRGDARAATTHPLRWVSRAIPWFVVGFVVLAGLRSAGALDMAVGGTSLADAMSVAAGVLILVALAGVGLGTQVRSLAGVGPRPFALGLGMWIVILFLGLALATIAGPGLR